MAVPNTFATDTGSIPLADLDANFSYYDGAFNIASNIFTFADTVRFQDLADATKIGVFSFAGITTGTTVTYTFPNVTGTLATLGNLTQSFAGAVTVANAFTVTGTSTSTSIQSTQSTGTITVGGTAGTGAITVGQSTAAQTLNFGTGANTTGVTKAINIGTAGVSGSITTINIGSAVSGATGTTTINSSTVATTSNLGVGGTPTSRLSISGGALPTSATNLNFSAQLGTTRLTTDAGAITSFIGGWSDSTALEISQGSTSGYVSGMVIGARSASNATVSDAIALFTRSAERMRIDSSGNVLVTSAASLGYGTGSGGTVTQATSKVTAVTLNKPTGQITMNNAALAAGASVIFALNNSLIAATDTVILSHSATAGTANAYVTQALTCGAGSVAIRVTNITAGSLSEAAIINFSIIKGATS